jgi:hypothetical protein
VIAPELKKFVQPFFKELSKLSDACLAIFAVGCCSTIVWLSLLLSSADLRHCGHVDIGSSFRFSLYVHVQIFDFKSTHVDVQLARFQSVTEI